MFARYIVFLIVVTIASCKHLHFYRKDYTFFEDFDAFYKLHWDKNGISWDSAFMACDDEGAKLFYPKQDEEWTIVKNLTAYLPETPNVTEIFIGIHDDFGLGEFMTVDGQSVESALPEKSALSDGQHCIVMDVETGRLRYDFCNADQETVRPFVCEKANNHPPCPTIDKDYLYRESTKKCYKVNMRGKTWLDAMHTCFMEGGVLVVAENESEAQYISTILDISAPGTRYFAGFRKWFIQNEIYTVKGKKLSESAYIKWDSEENNENLNCGTYQRRIYNYEYLYTTMSSCGDRLPFVCEIKAIV